MTQTPLWQLAGFAALTGMVAAFGLAPYGAWPVTLLGLVLLGAVAVDQTRRRAAWIAWSFAAGYFAHALSWIAEPFLVDAALHGWMIPFALTGMAGGLALFWALAAWIAGGRAWLTALLIALAELARGYVLTGFPWAGLAQIWIDTPLAQSLAVIGPYGLGAMTLLATMPLGAALQHRRGRLTAVPVALLAALVLLPSPQVTMTDQTVRIVQPNAEQHLRWDPDWIPVFFDRHMTLSTQEPAVDLVVWSENAIPGTLGWDPVPLESIATQVGVPLLSGVQRVEDGAVYNSAILLGAGGVVEQVYDKHHLVPFGEYMPLPGLFRSLGIRGLAERVDFGYTAGPGPSLIDLPGIGAALPLICYEAVFPQDLRGTARPAVLLAITNDAWFGARSGPYQHLVQARMRAIEQGLPMIRAANTGISAMIDPTGQVTAMLPLGSMGALDAVLPAALPPTVYSRLGDWPAGIFVAFAALGLLLRRKRTESH
ncbi:MAG: apolipoprotein N-acyltransferase [Rhodobacteraceae bacterium]|nr:apolipoprotein N-acyltransferase [Paracoccaceae bacterium]